MYQNDKFYLSILKTTQFSRKQSLKRDTKKDKKETSAAGKPSVTIVEDKRARLPSVRGWRKRKKKGSQQVKETGDEIISTLDLFPQLGKANVERVVREICASNPKWAPVIANHQRILSRGIHLEFDTYLKGILLPMDYNEIVRLAIKKLIPRANRSRTSSTATSTLSVPIRK